jgi:hypothetical protein
MRWWQFARTGLASKEWMVTNGECCRFGKLEWRAIGCAWDAEEKRAEWQNDFLRMSPLYLDHHV